MRRTSWRHACHFGPLLVLSTAAFVLAAARSRAGTPLPLCALYGAIVALNVSTIAMSTWSTVLGFGVILARRSGWSPSAPVSSAPTGRSRTAILLPIYEEDAARVFAAARVMADDLAEWAVGAVDVYVLSDSGRPDAVANETAMHRRVAGAGDGGPRIFYRHRARNLGRKAGNIADFVTRWGAAHDFMVVLDADSLMTGAAIARLVGMMEANPSAGLIQAMCYPVGRTSLFARLQHFNARLHGALFQHGVAFWQDRHGNSWGHNAIIRIDAFAAHCGLPILPNGPPFGGEILSHDTVEAALMLRGGYDVWMVPHDPDDGSWEETPTNLLDHFERDRRWCRGNLQHLAVLRADGLATASLYHLGRGLLHYGYAPLVVAWVLLYAAIDRGTAPDGLFALVAGMILVPRLLCLATALADRDLAAGFGGRWTLCIGAAIDQIASALTYPVSVAIHLRILAATLVGAETGWSAQIRGERGVGWRAATRYLARPIGLLLAGLALLAFVAPLPVTLFGPGLVLGIPLAVVGSRRVRGIERLWRSPEDARSRPWRDAVRMSEQRLHTGTAGDPGTAPPALPLDSPLAMPTQILRMARAAEG